MHPFLKKQNLDYGIYVVNQVIRVTDNLISLS